MFKKENIMFFMYVLAICIGIEGILSINKVEKVFESNENKSYLAIIIDDFGYGGEGTDEMLSLDIDFTAAVMPFSEKSESEVEKIKNAGKEMIIHMPMESLTGKRSWVGDKGVFLNMTDEEIKSAVNDAFDIVDSATGLNNHMGSAIMENEKCLCAVIDVLKEKDCVFVDSVTTAKSLGNKICNEKQICFMKRDVFLDSTDDINVVKTNIRKAGEIALKNGSAVAIGHVGPEGGKITAQALGELKNELEEKGIEFVTVSTLRKINEGREYNK